MATCNYRCKDCNHEFSITVHGSDKNCPKKGDYLRNCPKCESRNVKMTGGSLYVIITVIIGIIVLLGAFIISTADFRI